MIEGLKKLIKIVTLIILTIFDFVIVLNQYFYINRINLGIVLAISIYGIWSLFTNFTTSSTSNIMFLRIISIKGILKNEITDIIDLFTNVLASIFNIIFSIFRYNKIKDLKNIFLISIACISFIFSIYNILIIGKKERKLIILSGIERNDTIDIKMEKISLIEDQFKDEKFVKYYKENIVKSGNLFIVCGK